METSTATTTVTSTLVRLNLPLRLEEVRFLRGVFIQASRSQTESPDILLHNHDGDALRYAYPMVQYKCLDGNAAVVVLSHGDDDMPDLVIPPDGPVNIGRRMANISLAGVYRSETEVRLTEKPVRYRIENYLPFNQENHARFGEAAGLVARLSLIEECITGNILSMCKGLGVWIDGRIECSISDYKQLKPVVFKGVSMLRFSVEASVNVALPPLAGLGKGVSHGFGTLVPL